MGFKCVFDLRKAPLLIQEVDVSILFAPPNVPRVVLCPVRVYMGNVLHSQHKVLGHRFISDVSDQNAVVTNADFFFLEVQCLHFLEQETIEWKLAVR